MKKTDSLHKLSSLKEFAVLLYSKDTVKGCHFRKKGNVFVLKNYGKCPSDAQSPEESWKLLKKNLGFGNDCIVFLSGTPPGDNFFFRTAMPELPLPAAKQALTLELPRVIPHTEGEEDHVFQFIPAGHYDMDEMVQLNVLAFPRKGLHTLCSMISQSLRKVDYFVYPLLPLRTTDPALYLPEAEEEFFFADGQWHPLSQWDDSMYEVWEKSFKTIFELPVDKDFSIREYLGCLLIGRFASSGDFAKRSAAVNVLPHKLRPARLRTQLRVMTILLILLCGGLIWEFGGEFLRESKSISALEKERRSLDSRVRKLKRQLKAGEKERKELRRLLGQKPGAQQILEKMSALSSILPPNVMVQNLRWTDSSVDLTLRSEAENLNLPALFRQLPHWKISQLQERRRNFDAASTITLKLVPVTTEGGDSL